MEDRACRDAFYEISQLAQDAKGLSDDEQLVLAREILELAKQILTSQLTPERVRSVVTSQVYAIAPDADANALFDRMKREAEDDAVRRGDGFLLQAQIIVELARAAEQRLLPDEHVVLVQETSEPEAFTRPTNYPTAGRVSNSAGTSSMPEARHCETEALLHQEQQNNLQQYLLMYRQRVEECCRAYRNGRSVCLRSHELQRREPSTMLLCCLCGGQRRSNFCMSCAECSWDVCRQCVEYLRDNVARLEKHAFELQKAEDGLVVGLMPCFYPEKPLNFASLMAVTAALNPCDQKLAICLESIQVAQILHEMPVPNVRYSQTLNEAALEMRNGQNAGMLLKVSNCLAPEQSMPPNRATSPRCRRVSIRWRWLLPQLCVAAAVLLLGNCTRFHQPAAPTRRMQLQPYRKALVATSCGLAGVTLGALQLCREYEMYEHLLGQYMALFLVPDGHYLD